MSFVDDFKRTIFSHDIKSSNNDVCGILAMIAALNGRNEKLGKESEMLNP